jgi:hypothetical protein
MREPEGKDCYEVDLIPLIKLLLNCIRIDKRSAVNIYNLFINIYDDAPFLQNIFILVNKLLKERKSEIFENLPAVVSVIVAAYRKQTNGSDLEKEKEVNLISAICLWMKGIMIMLDKENKYDNDEEIRQHFSDMI